MDVGAIQAQEHTVLIGNRKWIKEKNFIDIPPDVESKLLSQEKLGHTAILAAVDGVMTFMSYFPSSLLERTICTQVSWLPCSV